MRPKVKIEDVVRVSGVSRATVDRVLNNRAGVKEATRKQVVEALETLGYAPDALSALRDHRTHEICVFLLDGTNPFFAQIRTGFQNAMKSARTMGIQTRAVNFDPYKPETLDAALHTRAKMSAAIIAVGADTQDTGDAIRRLQARGIPVITVISDIPSAAGHIHVGQDNMAAGRTAGRLMANLIRPGAGKIGVLIGHMDFKHLLEHRAGFQESLAQWRPDLELVDTQPYGGANDQTNSVVDNLYATNTDLRGIYLAGGGQPKLIEALRRNRTPECVIIGHELNPLSQIALEDGTFQALVCHDIPSVARIAFDAAVSAANAPRGAKNTAQRIHCGINIYFPENLPRP